MANIKRWKVICFLIGTVLVLSGIVLLVLYQNLSNFNVTILMILLFVHNQICLDYLLLISGSILISIVFFQASTQMIGNNHKENKQIES